MKDISIGFSPCPNDTFMFDAMINGKLNNDFDFDVKMADIEQLNKMAFSSKLDVTKLSYHAYIYLSDEYQILNCGSALGNNCGPLLLSDKPYSLNDINKAKIAIPGEYTTANMLLGLAFPEANNKEEVLFSNIENKILDSSVDLGLVIHENRFTYESRGLYKLMDLGEFWEEKTQLPIPLGAIVIRRSLPQETKLAIENLLRESIQYAFDNPSSALPFIQDNSQTMDDKVMYQHIELYVNEYSLDLGEKGKASIHKLFELMLESGKITTIPEDLFVS